MIGSWDSDPLSRGGAMTARALVLGALLLAPAQALAWWAWNRHEVLPVGGGVFEVIAEPGSGAQTRQPLSRSR
ncbi:MAG: hypothetical protein ACK5MY_19090 [Jhaorihella sp.]